MSLSIAQLETLSDMIKTKRPPWEVNQFLMGTCGLKFDEASKMRRWAIDVYRGKLPEPEEEIIPTPLTPIIKEEPSFSLIQEQVDPQILIDDAIIEAQRQREEEDNTCITCHCPLTEACLCKVRTADDIPF